MRKMQGDCTQQTETLSSFDQQGQPSEYLKDLKVLEMKHLTGTGSLLGTSVILSPAQYPPVKQVKREVV